jgi:hypothetical protein
MKYFVPDKALDVGTERFRRLKECDTKFVSDQRKVVLFHSSGVSPLSALLRFRSSRICSN